MSGRSAGAWRGKRAFDVVGALVLLVVLVPALVVVALVVALTSRGPVLFRQQRVGYGGRTFAMLKFRTMHADAEQRLREDGGLDEWYVNGGYKIPAHLDPRVTRVGRWLRMSSLDELPQLFNVLAGHMSLVGPRPVVSRELDEYGDHVGSYLALRPGLTGLWQVEGRNDIAFPERAEIDSHYHANCGPWLDVAIVARTPLAVVSRRGVD